MKYMSQLKISRRALMAALGGSAIALPMLEIFGERYAFAAGAPLRFLIMYAGVSQGNDGCGSSGGEPNFLKPSSVGAAYQLPKRHSKMGSSEPSPLQPLITHGVKDNVAVISGLNIPRGPSNTSAPPPAGMSGGTAWHTGSMSALLSGVRGNVGKENGEEGYADITPQGTTADLLAADAIGKGTVFPSLNYRINASGYDGGDAGERGQFSYRNKIPKNSVQSPHDAFLALNGQVKTKDPAAQARLQAEAARKRNVLDMVTMKSRIVAQLGKSDQERLGQHFEQVSAYQKTLTSVGTATCDGFTDPQDTGQAGSEVARAKLFAELIKMGFQCDLSRSALLGVTAQQSWLKSSLWGNAQAHQVLHDGSADNSARMLSWHMEVFANMVELLKKTPDIDGKTLLDNTAVVYLFEGGADTSRQVSHSAANMVAFAAGRAAGKAAGQHISTNGKHPGSVTLSALRNAGMTGAFGEVTEALSETLL
jgi:Protein of unknown function (DUF1552)